MIEPVMKQWNRYAARQIELSLKGAEIWYISQQYTLEIRFGRSDRIPFVTVLWFICA